jgi:hypothetical protein
MEVRLGVSLGQDAESLAALLRPVVFVAKLQVVVVVLDLIEIDVKGASRDEMAPRPLLGHLLGECRPVSSEQQSEYARHRHNVELSERVIQCRSLPQRESAQDISQHSNPFNALDAFQPVQLGDQAGGRTLGPKVDPVGQVKRGTLLGRGSRSQFEQLHGSGEQTLGRGPDPFCKPDPER